MPMEKPNPKEAQKALQEALRRSLLVQKKIAETGKEVKEEKSKA